MSPKFVNFNFTTPQGEKRSEPVVFGDSEGSRDVDVMHRKLPWTSYSAWIGSSWRGYTEYAKVDGRSGVYMKEEDGIVIAFLPYMYGKDSLQVGQTGIGRVYSGYITNRVPAWKKRPRKIRRGLAVLAVAAGAMLSGCLFSVPIPLAPGAEQVSVTHNSSQVASCTPVGNIDARIGVELADSDRIRAMQNQAVGLGGNVVLDTSLGGPAMGVIYRCGQIASPVAH